MSARMIERFAVWAGGAGDVLFGVLVLFFPRLLAAPLHTAIPADLFYVWVSGLFAMGLGAFYLLGASDPARYRGNLFVAAAVRVASAALFAVAVFTGRAATAFLGLAAVEALLGVAHFHYAVHLHRGELFADG